MDPKIRELFVQLLILVQESADVAAGLMPRAELTTHVEMVRQAIDKL
jgi:hypothetical protein